MYSASVAAEAMRTALAGNSAARVPEKRRLAEKADPRNLRIQVIYDDSTSLLTEPQRYLLLQKLMPWATATLSRLLKVRNPACATDVFRQCRSNGIGRVRESGQVMLAG